MMVAYTDTNKEYAAKVCNAVVSSYLSVRAQSDQSRVNKLESLLAPEIDHWKSEVERLQLEVPRPFAFGRHTWGGVNRE